MDDVEGGCVCVCIASLTTTVPGALKRSLKRSLNGRLAVPPID